MQERRQGGLAVFDLAKVGEVVGYRTLGLGLARQRDLWAWFPSSWLGGQAHIREAG